MEDNVTLSVCNKSIEEAVTVLVLHLLENKSYKMVGSANILDDSKIVFEFRMRELIIDGETLISEKENTTNE
jgi:hypothetical protein